MTRDVPGYDPHDGVLEPAEVKPPGFFKRLHARSRANRVTAFLVKVLITLIGMALLIVGIIMIFTPGQGILAIIAGLALLSLEYAWAQRALVKTRNKAQAARDKFASQDPAERRRKIWIGIGLFLCVVILLGAYFASAGYPNWLTSSWNFAQGFAGWLPELPLPEGS
jgi:uncharacterized protein (TIGR02611 family)